MKDEVDSRERTRGRRHRRDGGTTLIELLMGTVLALVVLGGIVTVTVSSASLRRTDDELNLAFRACRAKIEELRSLDFKDIPAQDGTGFEAGGDPVSRKLLAVPGDPDGLPGEVSIELKDAVGPEKIYKATVMVVWSGASQRRRFGMTCLLADRRRRK